MILDGESGRMTIGRDSFIRESKCILRSVINLGSFVKIPVIAVSPLKRTAVCYDITWREWPFSHFSYSVHVVIMSCTPYLAGLRSSLSLLVWYFHFLYISLMFSFYKIPTWTTISYFENTLSRRLSNYFGNKFSPYKRDKGWNLLLVFSCK